jgi:hypothetical protein
MSRFSGMNQSQAYTAGSYFGQGGSAPQGVADCVIKDVLYKLTRNNGPAVIVELEVTSSSDPGTPAGSKKSVVQTLNKRNVAFPNLLAFLGAAMGADPNNAAHVQWINTTLAPQSESQLESACEQKTLNGKPIRVVWEPHTTKDKNVITRTRFSPITD